MTATVTLSALRQRINRMLIHSYRRLYKCRNTSIPSPYYVVNTYTNTIEDYVYDLEEFAWKEGCLGDLEMIDGQPIGGSRSE